ncbi:MAG TPA: S41 family peptidase, partial [Burkholderiaceae bacterium]|nr:S41 family peptidase [Burkholderiaceae bacterium]
MPLDVRLEQGHKMHSGILGMRALATVLAALALASCGGGGGGGPIVNPGVMAQTCSRNNPYVGDATAPTTVGSITTEKTWLRDHFDRNYLWYTEVPNVDPSNAAFNNDTPTGFYTSIDNYFNALLTPAITASGKFKDQFSFTYPTAAWDALINSGSTVGYGIEWHFGSSVTPPRNIRVAYVHAGSQADNAGVRRGDTLVSADGVSADDTTQSGVDALNAALFPASGSAHTLRLSRGPTTTNYQFVAGSVTLKSVQSQILNINTAKVGYLLFNDHVLTAEPDLINAMAVLQNNNVSDLVLDLRYNGGGYLFIASEVAYMIAGAARTNGMIFETTLFNNKRSNENSSSPFENVACLPDASFQCTSNALLPTLNLPRVYVLVSGSTCSASEAIINGLRGVDVDVRLIGSTTCGKPYGFFSQDNCGITYFPIEFQGVNAKGFGDYADGFIPGGTGAAASNVLGCAANDDLDHALGDPAEGQLASALAYRASGNSTCLPLMAGSRVTPLAAGQAAAVAEGGVVKPAPLTNRNGRMPAR